MFPDLARDDVFRLETRRLWLRWPRAQDAASVAREAGHPEVAQKTVEIPHPYLEGAAAEFILTARKANADGERLVLMLTPKAAPFQAIGCVALRPSHPETRLRFWLGQAFWGKGLMTEAVRGLTDLVFSLTDCEELEAAVPGLNPAALRVLAKSGFLPTGSQALQSRERGGQISAERFGLERLRWSRDYGRRRADAQNAPSVLRA